MKHIQDYQYLKHYDTDLRTSTVYLGNVNTTLLICLAETHIL